MSPPRDDRPSRRPRREREEDYEEPPRRRRPRRPPPEQVSPPILPLVYGILSCTCSCAAPIGFACAGLALYKANEALDELPSGRRGDSARNLMGVTKILAFVGMGLSGIALVVAIILTITGASK